MAINEPILDYYCYYQDESYEDSIMSGEFFVTDKYYEDRGPYVKMGLHNNENDRTKEGFVKGPRTYLATDDLVIGPSSPISASLLINRLQIPLDDLNEKIVTIGLKEVRSKIKSIYII
jgi:hypothetical protein